MKMKKISALLMTGMLALTACSDDPVNQEEVQKEYQPIVLEGLSTNNEDTIVATFSGDTRDLDSRLTGATINTIRTGSEWVSPEVKFNLSIADSVEAMVESLYPFVIYQIPDFAEVNDTEEAQDVLNYMVSLISGILGGSDGGEADPGESLSSARQQMIIQLLQMFPGEALENLARGLVAYAGTNFNGFEISENEALLTDHVLTMMLMVINEYGLSSDDYEDAAVFLSLAQYFLTLRLDDGILTQDGSFLVHAEHEANIIKAGTTFSLNLDGNFSCQDKVNVDSLMDIVDYVGLVSTAFGDVSPLVNELFPNDTNDACLAETRENLQNWLDEQLGRGVAIIPEGGVSSSALTLLAKTAVIIEFAKDMPLDGEETLGMEEVHNDYLDNLINYLDANTEDFILPVKTINMPANIIVDNNGRPNRAFSFKLSNLLAYNGLTNKFISQLSGLKALSAPEALPFDQEFNNNYGNVINDDSEMTKGEYFNLCFAKTMPLNKISGQRIEYYFQAANYPLVMREYDIEENCFEFEALSEIELPIKVTVPAGTVESVTGVTNLKDIAYEISDVTAPKVTGITYSLNSTDFKARSGLLAGENIEINFSEGIDTDKLQEALKDNQLVEFVGFGYSAIKLQLKKDIAYGDEVVTLKAQDVVDTIDVTDDKSTIIPMAEDYVIIADEQQIITSKYGDTVMKLHYASDEYITEKNALFPGADIIVPNAVGDVLGAALKYPTNVKFSEKCESNKLFFRNGCNSEVCYVEIAEGCDIKLQDGAKAIEFFPKDLVQVVDGSSLSAEGLDLTDFKYTLTAEEINSALREEKPLVGSNKDYVVTANYSYSPWNVCGAGILNNGDIINIDLGPNGYFLQNIVDTDELAAALTKALNRTALISCGNNGDLDSLIFSCMVNDTSTDYVLDGLSDDGDSDDSTDEAEVAEEIEVADGATEVVIKFGDGKDVTGSLTVKLPVANKFTMSATTRGVSDHDGKLVYGDMLVIESACASDSLAGALDIMLNKKLGDVELVASDRYSMAHRNRYIFKYFGEEDLDLTEKITVKVPSLFDNYGQKMAGSTLTLVEKELADEALFTYVAGSAKGNTASFVAKGGVAKGSYAVTATKGFEAAEESSVLFAADESVVENDNFYAIRQFIVEVIDFIGNLDL